MQLAQVDHTFVYTQIAIVEQNSNDDSAVVVSQQNKQVIIPLL